MKCTGKLIAICYFFLFSISLFSQNYKSITPNKETFFKSYNGDIRAIKIKSGIAEGSDSIYFNFNSIRDTSNGNSFPCPINPNGSSWVGEKIIIRSDGYNIFFNSSHDSIKINTISNFSESWLLYKFPNKDYIEASCIKIDTNNILGDVDSVKIFSLQLKDSIGTPKNSDYNNKEIFLSKNSGLIKLFDWFQFPNDTISYTIVNEKRYTNGEIYDFEVGDEFHFQYQSHDYFTYSIPSFYLCTVLERNYSSNFDTVFYALKTYSQYWAYNDWNVSTDTTIQFYSRLNSVLFDEMPEETMIDTFGSISYYEMLSNSFYNNRTQNNHTVGFFDLVINNTDTCAQYPFEPLIRTSNLVKGLGEVYWLYDAISMGSNALEKKLLYYKKGNETWGTPVIPLNIQSLLPNLQHECSLSPNPVSDFLKINLKKGNSIIVKVYNILGEEIYKKALTLSPSPQGEGWGEGFIDVSFLPFGAYIVCVSTSEKTFSQKLIVAK